MSRDVCTCGHDIATHYRDLATKARGACLARGCDCHTYGDEAKCTPVVPKPNYAPYPSNRPHSDVSCRCAACFAYDERNRWSGVARVPAVGDKVRIVNPSGSSNHSWARWIGREGIVKSAPSGKGSYYTVGSLITSENYCFLLEELEVI